MLLFDYFTLFLGDSEGLNLKVDLRVILVIEASNSAPNAPHGL